MPLITTPVYAKFNNPHTLFQSRFNTTDISNKLRWQPDKDNLDNLCAGTFLQPQFTPMDKQTKFQGKKIDAPLQGAWHLIGDASVEQKDLHIRADEAYLRKVNDKRTLVDAKHHIRIQQPGLLLLGDQGKFNWTTRSGTLSQGLYRMNLSDKKPPCDQNKPTTQPLILTSWGKAKHIEQFDPLHFTAKEASYSTCAPDNVSWHLRTEELRINKDTGRGESRHTTLYVKNFRVFYFPYFNFPIDDRRQSGFLSPSINFNSIDGWDLRLPYYFNLAPNYDLLLTTDVLYRRGVLFNSGFRYLTQQHKGQISLNLLPNDKLFNQFQKNAATQYANHEFLPDLSQASHIRKSFAWHDQSQWNTHISSTLNYNWLSDNYWLNDLGSSQFFPVGSTSTNQLLQQITLNYDGSYTHADGTLLHYQSLQQVNLASVNRPYNHWPALNLSITPPAPIGIKPTLAMHFVRFDLNHKQPGQSLLPVTGDRLDLDPQFAFPWYNSFAYFTPKFRLHMSQYQLQNQGINKPNHISRNLPIMQTDSGLFFERTVSVGSHDWLQTLEPRLTYTYVPYRDQLNIPNFGSGILHAHYSDLFSYNRFSGTDRIGDTQKISLGVTTRFISTDSGNEVLRLSMGQSFHYGQERVTLCSDHTCEITTLNKSHQSDSWNRSNIASELVYHFNETWQGIVNQNWDPSIHHTVNFSSYLSYVRDQQHIINVGYNYALNLASALDGDIKENVKQATASIVWPFARELLLVAGIENDVRLRRVQDYFFGIEYNSCCSAFRIVKDRTFNSLGAGGSHKYEDMIYLQWHLTGLGSLSTQRPRRKLNTMIPHYKGDFVNQH